MKLPSALFNPKLKKIILKKSTLKTFLYFGKWNFMVLILKQILFGKWKLRKISLHFRRRNFLMFQETETLRKFVMKKNYKKLVCTV